MGSHKADTALVADVLQYLECARGRTVARSVLGAQARLLDRAWAAVNPLREEEVLAFLRDVRDYLEADVARTIESTERHRRTRVLLARVDVRILRRDLGHAADGGDHVV